MTVLRSFTTDGLHGPHGRYGVVPRNKPFHHADMLRTPQVDKNTILALKPRHKVRKRYVCGQLNSSNYASVSNLLPVELWSEIFLHCLPQGRYPQFKAMEAPLVLGQICRAWRLLALSTPQLWSSFEIEITHSKRKCPREYIRLLTMTELWLRRSGICPLSIRIHYTVGASVITSTRSAANPVLAKLIAALISDAPRWRDVHLLVPSVYITPLQQSLPVHLSSLRSLTLEIKGASFSTVPFDVHTLGINWTQLTELHFNLDFNHLLTLDDVLRILSESTKLTRCFMNADCVFVERRRSRRIPLPKLTHLHLILQGGTHTYLNGLRVSETPDSCLVAFLNTLALSNLTMLELDWLVQWDDDNRYWSESHSQFIAFLDGLTPSLEALRLAYLPLVEREVLECLAYLPHLMHLELLFSLGDKQHDPITDEFIRALSIPSSKESRTSGLLPRLHSVNLQSHGARCKASSLAELIESRWTLDLSIFKLKTFHFLSLQPVTERLRQRIKKWEDEGLDVDIDTVVIR